MNTDVDYTYSFVVPVDAIEAFAAAAAPQTWWNEMIERTASQVGRTFIFDVPGLHHSKFLVTEADVGKRLAWKVIPSGDETELDEWIDTIVVFDFAPGPAGTHITFTHRGLQPQLECHTVCSTAWAYHLQVGLQALLTGGNPAPITATNIDQVAAAVGARQL
jgi:hypothetical protein